ncbi:hypothetical protein ACXR0O_08220 [Verrucomicrobiota bacterium sgz303538]
MSRTRALLLKIVCWSAVLALPVSAIGYTVMVNRAYAEVERRSLSGVWCGNSITDPLISILSFGTPAALIAVAVLGGLRLRRLVNTGSLLTAAVLTIACTGALIANGVRFFQKSLPGHHLSEVVWWMSPIGSWVSL